MNQQYIGVMFETTKRQTIGWIISRVLEEHEHRRVILLFSIVSMIESREEKKWKKKKRRLLKRSTSREHDSGDIDVYFIAGIIRSPKRLHQRGNYCFRFETYLLRSIAYESRNRILAFHKKFCFVRFCFRFRACPCQLFRPSGFEAIVFYWQPIEVLERYYFGKISLLIVELS